MPQWVDTGTQTDTAHQRSGLLCPCSPCTYAHLLLLLKSQPVRRWATRRFHKSTRLGSARTNHKSVVVCQVCVRLPATAPDATEAALLQHVTVDFRTKRAFEYGLPLGAQCECCLRTPCHPTRLQSGSARHRRSWVYRTHTAVGAVHNDIPLGQILRSVELVQHLRRVVILRDWIFADYHWAAVV
jgi:hypothetical protein